MKFEKRNNGYNCYGDDPWIDVKAFDMLEEIQAVAGNSFRGTLHNTGYKHLDDGYWLFEPRTDMMYSARELIEIAQKLKELG